MPPGGIRNHDLSRRATEDLRLRPRGNWEHGARYTSKIDSRIAITKATFIKTKDLFNSKLEENAEGLHLERSFVWY